MPATANNSTIAATFVQFAKTVAATGTPEALSSVELLVESAEIYARKSRGSANSGTLWIGSSSVDGAQLRPLAPGEVFPIGSPTGKKIDLSTIFIDVTTAGDGVIVSYLN